MVKCLCGIERGQKFSCLVCGMVVDNTTPDNVTYGSNEKKPDGDEGAR